MFNTLGNIYKKNNSNIVTIDIEKNTFRFKYPIHIFLHGESNYALAA